MEGKGKDEKREEDREMRKGERRGQREKRSYLSGRETERERAHRLEEGRYLLPFGGRGGIGRGWGLPLRGTGYPAEGSVQQIITVRIVPLSFQCEAQTS